MKPNYFYIIEGLLFLLITLFTKVTIRGEVPLFSLKLVHYSYTPGWDKWYYNSSIGEMEIRSFMATLKQDYQGCFITLSKFQKKQL